MFAALKLTTLLTQVTSIDELKMNRRRLHIVALLRAMRKFREKPCVYLLSRKHQRSTFRFFAISVWRLPFEFSSPPADPLIPQVLIIRLLMSRSF